MPPDNDVCICTGNNPVFLLLNSLLQRPPPHGYLLLRGARKTIQSIHYFPHDISGAILKTVSLNAFSGNPEGALFHRSGVSL